MTPFLRRFGFKKKVPVHFIDPDEIFLDSGNLPGFDTQQFEGRIERPISKNTLSSIGVVCAFLALIFFGRFVYLQLIKGDYYFTKSQNNSLDTEPIFARRGLIYDRNGQLLVWNTATSQEEVGAIPERSYIRSSGFAHILGYVSYPTKDTSGNFWQSDFVGKGGVEKKYDTRLKGKNGTKIKEMNATGEVQSENMVNPPIDGEGLYLSIDARVQEQMYAAIKELSGMSGYRGGAGLIMDVQTGELLTLTSYPEYDPDIVSKGDNKELIREYLTSSQTPLINRAVAGLYTPGSIVKPFVAMGALTENVIDPYKKILSTGSISIPNPYNPKLKTTFKDNKAHGWVDMRHAIAVSSNVYFYEVGGGFQGQKGLGILNLEKYFRLFSLGRKSGIDLDGEREGNIPSPDWKAKHFKNDPWRIGDTYNTAIGQYGVQVTPVEMVRAIGAVANYGTLVTPHVLKDDPVLSAQKEVLPLAREDFDVVHDGMRLVVTEGTAHFLNLKNVTASAKTGTAQIGAQKQFVNSWAVGFFPSEHPRYAFAVLMESAPNKGATGAAFAMGKVLDWMSVYTPEYTKN